MSIFTVAYIKEEFRTKSLDWYGKETRKYYEDIFDSGVVDNYDSLIGKFVIAVTGDEGEIRGMLGGIDINCRNYSLYSYDEAADRVTDCGHFLHKLRSLSIWPDVPEDYRKKVSQYTKKYCRELSECVYRAKQTGKQNSRRNAAKRKGC